MSNHEEIDRRRQDHLGRLLLRAYRAFSSQAIDRLAARGYRDIAPAHTVLLTNVAAEGIRLSELALRMGVSRQATGNLVAALEDRGYLARRIDPTDRRAALVSLTESGWELMGEIVRVKTALEADCAAALGPDRMNDFRAGLVELLGRLEGD